jgi:3-isopropylmalate/(R)-2-methylmalate dehydratase small subunit
MESLRRIVGIAAPMTRINIDTDQIIPARYLLRTSEHGLDQGLFGDLRYLADGSPDPAFVLNVAPYRHAVILLAGRNFGCGSSREAAPRALRQFGFRVIVAPSFGEIFAGNCFRNGLLPVVLPVDVVASLAARIAANGGVMPLEVDLEGQSITAPDGTRVGFEVEPRRRLSLLEGIDEIELTSRLRERIDAFRAGDRVRRPWAYL